MDSIIDVSYIIKNKRVFYEFEKWPCHYHLDILAHTNTWRTEENSKMLAESLNKIMNSDRSELIGVKADSWVVPYSLVLQEIVQNVLKSVNKEGVCEISVNDNLFKRWGPYGGMQLETDWKSKVRKNCDITFRALQLCYYADSDSFRI